MCSFPKIVRKVMEFDSFGHEKSWNLNFQKEYEPCPKQLVKLYLFRGRPAFKIVYYFSVISYSASMCDNKFLMCRNDV